MDVRGKLWFRRRKSIRRLKVIRRREWIRSRLWIRRKILHEKTATRLVNDMDQQGETSCNEEVKQGNKRIKEFFGS